jgi:hypothetical protein
MILEFEVIISKSLWKICWRLFGIRLLLASERCVTVGWTLAISFSCGRSNDVIWGGKIYKCRSDGQGSRGMWSKENVVIFPYINVAPMEEDGEANPKENIRISDSSKECAPSTTIRGDEEMEEGMKNVPCMKRMEWHGIKCELVNNVRDIIVEGRIVAYDPRELVLDNNLGETEVGVTILNCQKDIS